MTFRLLATSFTVVCLFAVVCAAGNLSAQERARSDTPVASEQAAKPASQPRKAEPDLDDGDDDANESQMPDDMEQEATSRTGEKPAEPGSTTAKTSDAKSDSKKPEAAVAVPSRTSSATKKGRYVPELPAEYNARDKNGDGQIALYEWDRKKYAEFAKLDKNGDGFLTPAELLPKEVLRTLYSKTPAAARTAGTAGSSPAGAPAVEGDAIDKEARKTFADLDQNKDGSLDESDWSKSRRTRGSFESAGITVSLPINADAFVPLYRRMKEAPGR